MVPNQPKKSLNHLGSCESFILPIWQGVLFEGPFLKDLTSTPRLYLWELEPGHGASDEFLRSFGHEVGSGFQFLGRFAPRENMQISKMKPYFKFLFNKKRDRKQDLGKLANSKGKSP